MNQSPLSGWNTGLSTPPTGRSSLQPGLLLCQLPYCLRYMSPTSEALESVQEHRISHSFPAGYADPDYNPNICCNWKVGINHCTRVHRPLLIPTDKNQLIFHFNYFHFHLLHSITKVGGGDSMIKCEDPPPPFRCYVPVSNFYVNTTLLAIDCRMPICSG